MLQKEYCNVYLVKHWTRFPYFTLAIANAQLLIADNQKVFTLFGKYFDFKWHLGSWICLLKSGVTRIWIGWGCTAQTSKPIPIFKGNFGR